MSVFDLALEKRYTDSPEAVLVDITPADLMLVRNNETGMVMRLPFSVLAEAVSGALTGYLKTANNLSDVQNAGTARTNLGLGNVDNTSDADKPVSTAQQNAINARIALTEKGAANGVTPLGEDSKVPAAYLPSFVDEVLEYANLASFPVTGESGKMYVALDSNKTYRWSGTQYIEISPSPGSTDAVPEGATNLYHTTSRAAAAAPVQSVAGRTGNIALSAPDISGLGTAAAQNYTEGSWTPTWNGGTVTVNRANYTRLGRLVVCQIDILFGSSSSGTDALLSLPFAPSTGFHTGAVNYNDYAINLQPNVDSGFGTNVAFRSDPMAGNLLCSQIAGKRVIFNLVYTL